MCCGPRSWRVSRPTGAVPAARKQIVRREVRLLAILPVFAGDGDRYFGTGGQACERLPKRLSRAEAAAEWRASGERFAFSLSAWPRRTGCSCASAVCRRATAPVIHDSCDASAEPGTRSRKTSSDSSTSLFFLHGSPGDGPICSGPRLVLFPAQCCASPCVDRIRVADAEAVLDSPVHSPNAGEAIFLRGGQTLHSSG